MKLYYHLFISINCSFFVYRLLAMVKKQRRPVNAIDYEENVIESEKNPVRKQWVDYDNVEDDDPFNLFGTAKPQQQFHSDTEDSSDDNTYHKRYSRDNSLDGKREKSMKLRLGAGFDSRVNSSQGVIDLRAKLQGKRRTGNRNW